MALDLHTSLANLNISTTIDSGSQTIQPTQAECLRVASLMYKRLPRELRNMIYQYLYIFETPIPVGSHHFTTYKPPEVNTSPLPADEQQPNDSFAAKIASSMGPTAVAQDHSLEGPDDIIMPTDRTLDPAYVGQEVAEEALVLYYSENTFSITSLNDDLPCFLHTDIGHTFPRTKDGTIQLLGITPFQLVRNLQVRIKYEHVDHFDRYYLWGDFVREQEVLESIYTNLKALVDGTNPVQNRKIEVIIMTNFHSYSFTPVTTTEIIRRLTNILESLRTPVYKLMYSRSHPADVTILHHDDNCFPFPRSLTSRFCLSRSDWEYECTSLKRARVVYRPEHYFVAPARKGDQVEEGFPFRKLDRLLKRRWACNPNLTRNFEWKITKSAYWPRGRSSMEDRREMRLSFSATSADESA